MSNINTVVIEGRLTRDPETQEFGEHSKTKLGVACSTWGGKEEKSNFFEVEVWGATGLSCQKYLEKGRQVIVSGQLIQDRWENAETGAKNSKVYINARDVSFGARAGEGAGDGAKAESGGKAKAASKSKAAKSDEPEGDFPF